ncbi:2',5' RNA ligase family [Rubripirellula lacrimiformis]|uniref:RNA 2',3'-cyclic phosphodiesterase n=1 Tax=Rubripirellula lacrimiformis TaxID=1930273 RepID=A0A517N6L1_9BACT|nr:RNA 2',3'-cyclic phosphodiesterase [Rubripirellula lacrimiformis]QDT02789.1 2',5' RNA ligase family [Rubripirellula lacrimiformis]
MQTIRSFIAIPLNREVSKAAIRLIGRLKEPDDGIKWVPTDNLHLTLKFLGEVENVEVPRICDAIRGVVEEFEPFDLHFGGTTALPSMDRPRAIVSGIEDPSGSLTKIVETLELDLAELGFKREPRDYVPHLTLGRTKGGSRRASEAVVQRIRDHETTQLGMMGIDEVHLIGSFLDKKGPSYHVLDTIDLG